MRSFRFGPPLVLCIVLLAVAAPTSADPPSTRPRPRPPTERPSAHYPSTLYADIAPTLASLASARDRLRVEPIGQSAGGLALYMATLSCPENLARLAEVQARRQAMIEAVPSGNAQPPIDLPAVVLINAGFQGNLYAGVDAALQVVRRLATDDSPATEDVLANVILLVNVAPNPDGRVAGSAGNATDLEPARDLVAQSQPETQAVVRLLASWSPMVVIDVVGYGSPMTIAASAPPRQIDGSDLYAAWSLDIAHAMSAAVHAATGHTPEATVLTPGAPTGEWPSLDLAAYAPYHGAYGLALSVATRDAEGVAALEAAMEGALAFVSRHRSALVRDQARLLAGGLLRADPRPTSYPSHLTGPRMLDPHLSFHPDPAAYLIPADGERQQDRHQAAALVDLLIANGLRVERTRQELRVQWRPVPAGAYLVRLDQPKGALAAALLWEPARYGGGTTDGAHAGWSLPMAWGVACLPLDRVPAVATEPVREALPPRGTAPPDPVGGYVYVATSNSAIAGTNALLDAGVRLYWAPKALTACQREYLAGSFVLPAGQDGAAAAVTLLTEEYGIDLEGICALPTSLLPLRQLHVATIGVPGVPVVLRELGFQVSPITAEELNAGHALDAYDVLIVSGRAPLWGRLSTRGRHAIQSLLGRGGHTIGIGAAGADLAIATGLADVDATITAPHFSGMAAISGDPDDPLTAAYPAEIVLLARAPVWFTYLPEDAQPVAHIAAGHLLTGYWPVWEDVNPVGQPTIVHLAHEVGSHTLFGVDPTTLAVSRHAFRLLAQAIYRAIAWDAAGAR